MYKHVQMYMYMCTPTNMRTYLSNRDVRVRIPVRALPHISLAHPLLSHSPSHQSAKRRPREDKFDKALYDEMAAYQEPQKIFFAPAPKTLGQKMDDQAAAGWKTYDNPPLPSLRSPSILQHSCGIVQERRACSCERGLCMCLCVCVCVYVSVFMDWGENGC